MLRARREVALEPKNLPADVLAKGKTKGHSEPNGRDFVKRAP